MAKANPRVALAIEERRLVPIILTSMDQARRVPWDGKTRALGRPKHSLLRRRTLHARPGCLHRFAQQGVQGAARCGARRHGEAERFRCLEIVASSDLVGWKIGISLGLAPFRIWSALSAMRWPRA